MFKYLWSFLKSLEQLEKYQPSSFWLCSIGLFISFSASFGVLSPESPQIVIEKNTASVLAINSDGAGSKQKSGTFVLRTGLGKRKKFDIVFHRRLEQHFPDWKARIDYQKKQEEFYKLAMRKKREMIRLRMKEDPKFYTKEELDAMDYFHGTGFYQKQQDPEVKPNIFDTRQSFLLKIDDPVLRNNFLNSFNSQYC